jgi:hypothetical protein
VSHDPSRKQFFAKLLGLIAAAGVAPKLLARSSSTPAAESVRSAPMPFQLRPEARAVSRRADSV